MEEWSAEGRESITLLSGYEHIGHFIIYFPFGDWYLHNNIPLYFVFVKSFLSFYKQFTFYKYGRTYKYITNGNGGVYYTAGAFGRKRRSTCNTYGCSLLDC